MAEFKVHDVRISLENEMPQNSLHLRIHLGADDFLSLYMADIDEWRALRNALPRSSGYWLSIDDIFLKGEDAEKGAEAFYRRECERRTVSLEVKTNDEML